MNPVGSAYDSSANLSSKKKVNESMGRLVRIDNNRTLKNLKDRQDTRNDLSIESSSIANQIGERKIYNFTMTGNYFTREPANLKLETARIQNISLVRSD